MYAVIQTGGKQYRVKSGEQVKVEALPADVGAAVSFDNVLMLGEGDGLLDAGPLKGIRAPLIELRRDYFTAMGWNEQTGRLSRARAEALGIRELLADYVEG